METKRILFGGLSNEPNDYLHEDGDLSVSVNAVKHNGSMRVIPNGKYTGISLKRSEKLVYIHHLPSGGVRYIVLRNNEQSGHHQAPSITSAITLTAYRDAIVVKGLNVGETFSCNIVFDGYVLPFETSQTDRPSLKEEIDGYTGISPIVRVTDAYVKVNKLSVPEPVNVHVFNQQDMFSDGWNLDDDSTETKEDQKEETPTECKYSLLWFKENDDVEEGYPIRHVITTTDEVVRQVVGMRNILIVSTDKGLRYVRTLDDTYSWLGELPKFPYVYPYLQTSVYRYKDSVHTTPETTVKISSIKSCDDLANLVYQGTEYVFTDVNEPDSAHNGEITSYHGSNLRNYLYETYFAMFNQLRHYVQRRGQFSFPFYVRLAFRIGDSNISVTRPFLMMPNSSGSPFMYGYPAENNTAFTPDVAISGSTLKLYIESIPDGWEDIITDVDVYATPAIVNYTDNAATMKVAKPYTDNTYTMFADSDETATIPYRSTVQKMFVSELQKRITTDPTAGFQLGGIWEMNDKFYRSFSAGWYRVPKRIDGTYPGNFFMYVDDNNYKYPWINEGTPDKPDGMTDEEYVSNYKEQYPKWCKIVSVCGYEQAQQYGWVYFDFWGRRIWRGDSTRSYEILWTTDEEQDNIMFTIDTQRADGHSYDDMLKNEAAYYRIASIKMKDIDIDSHVIIPEIDEHTIENIATLPRLDAGEISGYKYICNDVRVYNNRVNAIVEKQEMEQPDYIENFCSEYKNFGNNGLEDSDTRVISDIIFHIVRNGRDYYMYAPHKYDNSVIPIGSIRHLYYNNNDAQEAYLLTSGTNANEKTRVMDVQFKYKYNGEMYDISAEYALHYTDKVSQIARVGLTQCDNIVGVQWQNSFGGIQDFVKDNKSSRVFTTPEDPANFVYFVGSSRDPEDLDTIFDETALAEVYGCALDRMLRKIAAFAGMRNVLAGEEYNITLREDILLNEIQETDNTIYVGNKIVQTLAENPFNFRNSLAYSLNCDNILRICNTSRPISDGQAGDFPLYAFADNGIWALSLNEEGKYVGEQLVSADVLCNPDSVTQLDQSLLFATSRGLMHLSGGNVECIIESLKGHNYTENISQLGKVLEVAGVEEIAFAEHIEDWFKDAMSMLDYKRKLVYFFHEGKDEGLVYSITDNTWGAYENTLSYPMRTFTDALAVDKDNNLVNMSENEADYESVSKPFALVTRPMTFGVDDIHKTIDDIIVRGIFDKGTVKLVVWASNNSIDWYVIGSSQNERWRNSSGTPYKYFRVGVIGHMLERESLNGLSISFTPRLQSKIR